MNAPKLADLRRMTDAEREGKHDALVINDRWRVEIVVCQ